MHDMGQHVGDHHRAIPTNYFLKKMPFGNLKEPIRMNGAHNSITAIAGPVGGARADFGAKTSRHVNRCQCTDIQNRKIGAEVGVKLK